MALTAQELASRLGKHIGVLSLDPNDPTNVTPMFNRGLQPGDYEEFTTCINAALQELWSSAPTSVSHYRQTVFLPDPVTITLGVTHGSTVVDSFPDYAAWMPGCTVILEGGVEVNEVVDASALRYPYRGVTGSVRAKVYADCVTLLPEVLAMLEPVEYALEGKVAQALRVVLAYEDYQGGAEAVLKRSGHPAAAYLETLYHSDHERRTIRLRVTPLPAEAGTISFGTKLNVPSIDVTDISTLPDPGRVFPLPGGWDESVLLPIAARRMATHPDFISLTTAVRQELVAQANAAHRIMRGNAPGRSAQALYPSFR